MLTWARAFLVLTLAAAVVGLGRLAVVSVGIAQTLFVSFLAALLLAPILGLVDARKVVQDRNERSSTGPGSRGPSQSPARVRHPDSGTLRGTR